METLLAAAAQRVHEAEAEHTDTGDAFVACVEAVLPVLEDGAPADAAGDAAAAQETCYGYALEVLLRTGRAAPVREAYVVLLERLGAWRAGLLSAAQTAVLTEVLADALGVAVDAAAAAGRSADDRSARRAASLATAFLRDAPAVLRGVLTQRDSVVVAVSGDLAGGREGLGDGETEDDAAATAATSKARVVERLFPRVRARVAALLGSVRRLLEGRRGVLEAAAAAELKALAYNMLLVLLGLTVGSVGEAGVAPAAGDVGGWGGVLEEYLCGAEDVGYVMQVEKRVAHFESLCGGGGGEGETVDGEEVRRLYRLLGGRGSGGGEGGGGGGVAAGADAVSFVTLVSATDFPLRPDYVGLSLLLKRLLCGGGGGGGFAPLGLYSARHVLLSCVPYWKAALASSSVAAVHETLLCIGAVVGGVQKYCLDLEGGGGGGGGGSGADADDVRRKQDLGEAQPDGDGGGGGGGGGDEDATRVSDFSEDFDSVFQLLQSVSQVMVQCPLHSVRAGGVALLKAVLGTLRERTRFKMYLALVRACPYQSVVSLVVVLLKEEVCAEYGAFQAAVDGGADASALRRLKAGSAFLQADVALFFARYVEDGAARLADRGEGVAAALSLLLFVLLRETRLAEQKAAGTAPPGLGLQRTHLERLGGAVGALERALGGGERGAEGGVAAAAAACAPPGAAVQVSPMLLFSAERVREALERLVGMS